MAGASFILAINLFIAALFALAFVIVAATNRNDGTPRWFALAYCFGLLYIGAEIVLPIQINAQLTYTAGFAAFLGAITSITIGIASRYRQPVPWVVVGVAVVLSIVANWIAFDLGRQSLVRLFAYQAPYAVMQAVAAQLIWRSKRRQPMDVALLVLFCISALQFITKPLMAQWTGGAGDFAQSYIATTYALYSQSFGAILQVAVGLLTLLMLVRDMLVEITARSETDPLSALLNRRGFEDRGIAALAASTQHRTPVALIAADLDGFKAINDSFGHDTGDQVIIAFASLLLRDAPAKAIVSRMGGEEFAVLLPATAEAPARALAQRLRDAVAARGLPHAHVASGRVSLSIGVATMPARADTAPTRLVERADAALYAAKRSGRDRIVCAD